MRISPVRVLLLLTSFGMTLNLLPQDGPDSKAKVQSATDTHRTTRQGGEAPKLSLARLREPVSTGNVQCDQNWLSTRSADLISPAGVRASVELRGATLFGKTADDNRCETTWILHISGQGSPHDITVDTRDDEWYYEHIFEMNGWSKDGTLLLMSQIEAAGDWDQTTPVIYNIQDHRMWLIELAPLFDNFTPKDCSLYFRPMGFTKSGKIMLDVGSLDESDSEPGEKPCFQNSLWALDYTAKSVTKVLKTAAFESFGTVSGKSSSPARD